MDERRATERYSVDGVALVLFGCRTDWLPVVLLDISEKGMAIAFSAPLVRSTAVQVRMTLPSDKHLNEFRARCIFEPAGLAYGLQVGTRIDVSSPQTSDPISKWMDMSRMTHD